MWAWQQFDFAHLQHRPPSFCAKEHVYKNSSQISISTQVIAYGRTNSHYPDFNSSGHSNYLYTYCTYIYIFKVIKTTIRWTNLHIIPCRNMFREYKNVVWEFNIPYSENWLQPYLVFYLLILYSIDSGLLLHFAECPVNQIRYTRSKHKEIC